MLKKIGLSILDFLLFSHFFIAFCAVAQGLVTYYLLNASPHVSILAFLFFSTLVVYNLSVLLSRPKAPAQSPFKRVKWIFAHHQLVVYITIVAGLGVAVVGLLYLNAPAKLLMALVGLIALAYNVPFLRFRNKKLRLRNIPGAKLFIIGLVWALSCVLLPIVALHGTEGFSISIQEIILLVVKRFVFICAITVPFDIRDLYQDRLYQLKTIPVIWGEKKAWIFCQALLAIYVLLLVLFVQHINLEVIGLTLTAVLTGWLIFKSNFKRNEYYYFLYLDGTMILQYAILYFLHEMGDFAYPIFSA